MVRNSLYLILSWGLQGIAGFVFWIIVARLFSPDNVGKASSLISATSLIAYLALLGLTNAFVRYLPTARNRDSLITAGLLLVTVCGAGMGLIYAVAIPVFAPRLAFVAHRPVLAAGFALVAAAATLNLLTDSVFIAERKAAYTALTDGVIGGSVKILSALALAGGGAYSLYCASTGYSVIAALVSIVLMITVLRWRPSLRRSFQTLKPLLRFSSANYAANICTLIPNLVLPLIALDRLGAPAAAYYFVAYQLAALLMAAVYSVEQSFLAEGSQSDVNWPDLLRRSRRLLVALFLPTCLILLVIAHWVLLVFGAKYSEHGTTCLILLVVAAIPLGANNWLQTVLRLSGRLRAIVWSNVFYAVSICALAWLMAPHGLTAMTAAWPIGGLLAAVSSALPCRSSLSGMSSAKRGRHRRSS
jgi:O-antigen/teichoic acid export membrane protein